MKKMNKIKILKSLQRSLTDALISLKML